MFDSSGLMTAPCGVPVSGVQSSSRVHDPLLQERVHKSQDRVVRNLFPKTGHEKIMGNRIKVGLKVRIHHEDVALT